MDLENGSNTPQPFTAAEARRDRKVTIGLSLFICLLFAGVIGYDYSREVGRRPFDPRMERAEKQASRPMSPTYTGYVPRDAVIPGTDGIFVVDDEGGFKKVPARR